MPEVYLTNRQASHVYRKWPKKNHDPPAGGSNVSGFLRETDWITFDSAGVVVCFNYFYRHATPPESSKQMYYSWLHTVSAVPQLRSRKLKLSSFFSTAYRLRILFFCPPKEKYQKKSSSLEHFAGNRWTTPPQPEITRCMEQLFILFQLKQISGIMPSAPTLLFIDFWSAKC